MNVSAQALAARDNGSVIESVMLKGDLSKLTPQERVQYYGEICRSLGLNPHTRPFEFLTLGGKMVLYAKRDAADQLRKINGISIEIVSRSFDDGLFTVHVRAKDVGGRTDEDFGVVPLADALKGEARANQILKAITKAKRRVTLSISGLGFLDETEVDDIPRQTARARNAQIAQIENPEERQEAAERAVDEWSDKQAASMVNHMRSRSDQPDVVLEEDGERPATADDFEATTGVLKQSFIHEVREHIRTATDAKVLGAWWNGDQQKNARRDFALTDTELKDLMSFCSARILALRDGVPA